MFPELVANKDYILKVVPDYSRVTKGHLDRTISFSVTIKAKVRRTCVKKSSHEIEEQEDDVFENRVFDPFTLDRTSFTKELKTKRVFTGFSSLDEQEINKNTFLIAFQTKFRKVYYRNDRYNIQCFPRCGGHCCCKLHCTFPCKKHKEVEALSPENMDSVQVLLLFNKHLNIDQSRVHILGKLVSDYGGVNSVDTPAE